MKPAQKYLITLSVPALGKVKHWVSAPSEKEAKARAARAHPTGKVVDSISVRSWIKKRDVEIAEEQARKRAEKEAA